MSISRGMDKEDVVYGWMVSPSRWTWVWVSSESWLWTGKPGLLQSMGLKRVRHKWVTELNIPFIYVYICVCVCIYIYTQFSVYIFILCHPLLLLPSVFPSIRVFSNQLALCIGWPKHWSFNFSISPSNEYSGLISFRIDWFDLLAVWGTLKSLL